jgi:multiple antibiotic resistance protein
MIEIKDSSTAEAVGVVPLGTPLMAGPAVLTTLLLLIDQYLVVIVIGSLCCQFGDKLASLQAM